MRNEDGKRISHLTNRTYPSRSGEYTPVGVHVNAEGPLHLKNVQFLDFTPNEFTGEKPCNIKFNQNYKFLMGATSSVEGSKFATICNIL